MTPESLARTLNDFLAEAHDAVVMEDGAVAFDLAQAKYSISGETHKCLLHLWSSERNVVRRVVDLETRSDVLRLAVLRMGQTRPTKLEICRLKDRRTPTAKRAARVAYQKALHRLLERRFSEFHVTQLSTAVDLERSFGPIYARGLLRKGQSAFAVLGVNAQETQASIDAALTFSILWLDACREAHAGKSVVEGVKLFIPWGCSTLTRGRMAHLDPAAAKWQLFEFDEADDNLKEIDLADSGNMKTRLVHNFNRAVARQRFCIEVARIHQLMPEAEVVALSQAELAFRCNGLEFARARLAHDSGSLRSEPEIVFGVGASERVLSDANTDLLTQIVRSVGEVRHSEGPRDHLLWRLHPERWLESLVVKNVDALDERLDGATCYSQVPAFSAADRAMIDVLAMTREGRLAVVELKADEDIHLPMQGLDYWSRVAWHHARGEFQCFGYFSAKGLSTQDPLLLLVAPALHVHPATDILLRYLAPQIEWTVIGIDERWRQEVKVIFRKRPEKWGRAQLPASA
jgi:hypothetical protein